MIFNDIYVHRLYSWYQWKHQIFMFIDFVDLESICRLNIYRNTRDFRVQTHTLGFQSIFPSRIISRSNSTNPQVNEYNFLASLAVTTGMPCDPMDFHTFSHMEASWNGGTPSSHIHQPIFCYPHWWKPPHVHRVFIGCLMRLSSCSTSRGLGMAFTSQLRGICRTSASAPIRKLMWL